MILAEPRPKYRGVFWHERKNRYVAKIKHHCRTCNLGAYEDPRVAARVYDFAAGILKGPDAKFNFDGNPPPQVPGVIIRNTLRQIGVLRD